MTPSELATYARQQYNATNDNFFSDGELYNHMYHAQDILSKEAKAIENTSSTSTVIGQQEYTYPTNTIAIKRITYDGRRLKQIKINDDDYLTGFLANTTATGTPSSFFIFDQIIYLRPVPNAVYTLKLFTFDRPQQVTTTSVLDVPEAYHLDMVNFLLWRMSAKDQNFQAAEYYRLQWVESVARCKAWSRKRLTAEGFNVVRDESAFPYFPWEGA